jgi:hypothetical protein
LEEDLAATRKRWKIVFLHRSPYGSPRHGSDEKVREDLEPVFVRRGVDVVFSSHSGLRGEGGRGRRLYPAAKSSWTASSASTHHAVLVRVNGWYISLWRQ